MEMWEDTRELVEYYFNRSQIRRLMYEVNTPQPRKAVPSTFVDKACSHYVVLQRRKWETSRSIETMRSVKQYTQCSPFSPGLKEITILENLLKGWRDVSHKCLFEFQVLHDPSSLPAPLSQTISRFPFLVQPVGTRTKRTIKDFVFSENLF